MPDARTANSRGEPDSQSQPARNLAQDPDASAAHSRSAAAVRWPGRRRSRWLATEEEVSGHRESLKSGRIGN